MTRDQWVGLSLAFLAGVMAGVEYMNYAVGQGWFSNIPRPGIASVPAAPLCPLLRGRRWLQASIVHRAENGREYHGCLYGQQWSAL